MKYHYYLFIMICFLSIAVPCNAMKKENRLHCIEEMTAVKHPLRVQYLAKDRVAMSNSKGCFIVDLTTKEAQQIDRGYGDPEVRVFSTQNGNKKIVSSWSWIDVCGGSVKIYNAETGALEWDKEGDNACFMACSSYDNAIYLAGEKGIVKHNYVTKNYEDIPINDRHCQYSLVMHPKKEILCIAEFDPGVLSFYTLDNVTVPFKTITLPVASYFCQYSPDGSYVVAGDLRDLFIIDPNREGDQYPCIKSKASEDFSVISFHPNSSVLAILSRHYYGRKRIVRYWDIKTQQLIDTALEFDVANAYDLDFSEDGLELMIVLEGKCIRTLVPFAVKERCAYLLFILNQLKEKENLPQDVVGYCGNILLETYLQIFIK